MLNLSISARSEASTANIVEGYYFFPRGKFQLIVRRKQWFVYVIIRVRVVPKRNVVGQVKSCCQSMMP